MFRGLYTAYTGMNVQQKKVDIISNNISNINTNGYKKDQIIENSFKDVLTSRIRDGKNNKQIGKMSLGVKVDRVYTDFSQGGLKQTDEPYDLAISGSGLFKVASFASSGEPEVFYTRDGSFTVDEENFLRTKDGLFVLSNNEKIQLENGRLRVNKDGSLYQNEFSEAKLDIVDFENLDSLRKVESSLFVSTEDSKEKEFTGTVNQGFLETSTVNSVSEMIELISATRIYEGNQKIIQTYDETMNKVVNEVGRVG